MPGAPSWRAATQPVSAKPFSCQPAASAVALSQLESVTTTRGSPWANSTRRHATSPAGFGSEPALDTATASWLSPARKSPATSTTVAEWKSLATPTFRPLMWNTPLLSAAQASVARLTTRSGGRVSPRRK